MQRLVARCCQSRANSTAPSLSSPKSRIALELNGIHIPSQSELLAQRATSDAPNVDISYLKDGATLASSLARKLLNNGSPSHSQAQPKAQSKTRRTYPAQPNTEQRRAAARPARETSMTSGFRDRTSQGGNYGPKRANVQQRQRDMSRLPKTDLNARAGPNSFNRTRPDNAPWQKGRPPRRSNSGSSSIRRSSVSRPTTTRDLRLSVVENLNEENALFKISEGEGMEAEMAEYTLPELTTANVGTMLSTQIAQLVPATSGRRSISPARLLEKFGGDYSRLSPHTTQDFLSDPRQIDAIKQAQLTLSKNRGVDLNARLFTTKLISSVKPAPVN
ncbi:hypothetical protein AMATHDRAFT_2271 [Amanita thiersii Skay4041]|uniref:Uncharacterized protein n=1 Tax=Amanita thiersii Skay4041 TaxID=703135 RepID=A0A2A9NWP7_9AGAR|nr:hypothetical protein AMATHDRAFT_2271 [Amanita thiersii Skay4041]